MEPSPEPQHWRFLVVDDVRFTRLTLLKMLRQLGAASVQEAGDGEEALALLRSGAAIDCIITDLEMPKLDGIALLAAVRDGLAAVPVTTFVVLLTGHSDLDRIGPALQRDVDAFLAKPVSQQALQACLQRLSEPRAQRPRAHATSADAPPAAGDAAHERLVDLDQLAEDVELARDLVMDNGRRLLEAGTLLTARRREQLLEILRLTRQSCELWVRSPPPAL
jgi:CheY-like chemotaxis protein